jgi:hypothetical protein
MAGWNIHDCIIAHYSQSLKPEKGGKDGNSPLQDASTASPRRCSIGNLFPAIPKPTAENKIAPIVIY